MSKHLKIVDLYAKTLDGKEILKGINLSINVGEVHAIMGPNGAGKSTLSNVIMGNPKYIVTKGDILVDDVSILNMTVDERAKLGIFLAMQNPIEISGVTNSDFIRASMKAINKKELSLFKFIKAYDDACKDLKMKEDFQHRYVNEGFSGGEKKKNEILQMKLIKPNFAILDEIDSGLDVDALKIVSDNVNSLRGEDFSCLMITHYERLLDYIKPDYAHVLINGKIVVSGKDELIKRIDQEGYDWIKREYNIIEEPKTYTNVLGTCGVKKRG